MNLCAYINYPCDASVSMGLLETRKQATSIGVCIQCVRRNPTDDKPDSAAGVYDALDLETRGEQPHYDVMPRDQQVPRDTAAGEYVTLDADTQAQQHPYDVIGPAI